MTISEIKNRIKAGETAKSIVSEAIEKIKSTEDYNAVLNLIEERAFKRANDVDAGNIRGKLAGVPFIAKDNFLTLGVPTTAASRMLENFDAPLQATVIEKLEAEGAICIGKANLDAFAHGGSTENSAFGPTKNAFDKQRVAGGSSGGSAVVTALDVVPFALGSDTGGSIRQPASYNGVFGIKPTYGLISRFGVIAMASSTDVVGLFAKSVEDIETVMDIMSGLDARDMTTFPDYFKIEENIKPNQRIGLINNFMTSDVDKEVLDKVHQYIEKLKSQGHSVENVDLSMSDYALAMYYIIVPAELSSNLARFDGIRYGHRSKGANNLVELYGKTRDEGFVTENKRRIMIGSYVLSSGFFDAYYLKAQKARTLLIEQFNQLFDNYDLLIGPTAPTPAFKLGENTTDPIKMYLNDIMTVPASLAGLPAISVPAGFNSEGLPIGVQLIGPLKSDARILSLAKAIQEIK